MAAPPIDARAARCLRRWWKWPNIACATPSSAEPCSPGQKVVEEQLCADLGISRAPLREALRLLAQQGLVERVPRRGSRVAEWSPTDILQLFALRHVLECHAIETALPLADPETSLRPVHAALDAMRAATDELDRDDAHRMFHAAVVGLAAQPPTRHRPRTDPAETPAADGDEHPGRGPPPQRARRHRTASGDPDGARDQRPVGRHRSAE